MQLKLVTLTGVKVDEPIYSATIPTVDGDISVFLVFKFISNITFNQIKQTY